MRSLIPFAENHVFWQAHLFKTPVAVGTTLANGPPHGSAQAGLRHAALTSDKSGQPLFRPGMKNAGRG
jgi:hypothetical protein